MRPTKSRIIGCMPRCRQFRPVEAAKEAAPQPGGEEAVVIALDMLEAMRLVDAEGMSQESAARSMDVSTPTLCRILAQGRRLAAQALSSGKSIHFEGGNIMYGNGMNGRHGQGQCHGRPGRHGQAAEGACCGKQAGRGQGQCKGRGEGMGRHGQGQCDGKGPGQGNGHGMGQGRRATGQCRREAADQEQGSGQGAAE